MFNKNDKEHRIRMTFKSDDKTIHNCLLTADANGNSAVFKIPDAPKLQKIFKSSLQKKTPSLEI